VFAEKRDADQFAVWDPLFDEANPRLSRALRFETLSLPYPASLRRKEEFGMRDNIISYQDMCATERMSLQRGMNFLASSDYSILLMSVRKMLPMMTKSSRAAPF